MIPTDLRRLVTRVLGESLYSVESVKPHGLMRDYAQYVIVLPSGVDNWANGRGLASAMNITAEAAAGTRLAHRSLVPERRVSFN